MKRIALCVAVALLWLTATVPAQADQPQPSPSTYVVIVFDASFVVTDAAVVKFDPFTPLVSPCFVAWWTENFVEREVEWTFSDLGAAGGYLYIQDDEFAPDPPGPRYDISGYYFKPGFATLATGDTIYGEAIEWLWDAEFGWEASGLSYFVLGFNLSAL